MRGPNAFDCRQLASIRGENESFSKRNSKRTSSTDTERIHQDGMARPEKKADIPSEIRPYTGFQDELSEANGILFKGEQIIVPKSMQKEMLQIIHQGHLGRDKSLAAAREVLFWPGMTSQIIDTM